MHNYDFKSLNDKEFESMVIDLLSCEFDKRIERFKQGKDQGIDGRFFQPEENEILIQCKHYLKSGFKALMRKLKNEELNKIIKLNPKRYIIATSLELSRHEKQQIKESMEPFLTTPTDVYGAEDLNDLLGKHPQVEINHYKLWITSTTVLRTVMNNAILGRSRHIINEAQEESCKYTITDNHNQAFKKIQETNAIILTGEPGIGKTTLANSLCLFYAGKNFEVICIEDSLAEAEAVYTQNKYQIFYYDDFLGRNYLTALSNKSDSHIVNFIKRVQKDKTKKFVLTSRTNILNQGKRLSDLFKTANIERTELEVTIENINRIDKAKILYNHIFFSELGDEFIEEIYKDKRYLKIIDNNNYNPRLIEFITDQNKIINLDSDSYWDYIVQTLKNPVDIWEKAFEVQIDQPGRDLVSLLVLNGTAIKEDELQNAFYSISNFKRGTDVISVDFTSTVRALTRALINRNYIQEKKVMEIDLFNPSIGDYVIKRIADNHIYLGNLFCSLTTLQSLNNLGNIYKNSYIDINSMRYILRELSKKIEQDQNLYDDYNFLLANILIKHENIVGDKQLRCTISKFLHFIEFNDLKLRDNNSFLNVLLFSIDIGIRETWHSDVENYIFENIDDLWGHDEFMNLCCIAQSLKIEKKEVILLIVKKAIIDYWKDCIVEHIVEDGTIDDLCHEEQIPTARKRVFESVEHYFLDYRIDITDIEKADICDHVSVEEIIFNNYERVAREEADYEPYRPPESSYGSENQFIDDFFCREK